MKKELNIDADDLLFLQSGSPLGLASLMLPVVKGSLPSSFPMKGTRQYWRKENQNATLNQLKVMQRQILFFS